MHLSVPCLISTEKLGGKENQKGRACVMSGVHAKGFRVRSRSRIGYTSSPHNKTVVGPVTSGDHGGFGHIKTLQEIQVCNIINMNKLIN